MPSKRRYIVNGTLRRTRFGTVVDVEGGDFWIVDAGWWTRLRHRNRRVTIEGIRCGFNVLSIVRLKAH